MLLIIKQETLTEEYDSDEEQYDSESNRRLSLSYQTLLLFE